MTRISHGRFLLPVVVALLAMAWGGPVAAEAPGGTLQLLDGNIRYTSGIFVPLPAYDASTVSPLTTSEWSHSARGVHRVAADGVSLVLIRTLVPRSLRGPLSFELVSDHAGADPGSLWAVDDQRVVDRSAPGGRIDDPGQGGGTTLNVQPILVNGRRYAFLIYRAPRDFDSATGSTALLAERPARLILRGAGRLFPPVIEESFAVVRPLVVFVHGTGSDNDAWISFPLWRDSANELQGYVPLAGNLPFAADRLSYRWIWNATGGVAENAESILSQLVAAIRAWREATGAAATQADVVTHSLGGFVARQVAQTQPDPDPLTPKAGRNFRAAANWGHGSVHKLITLAGTHRGSAAANASAYVNRYGNQSLNDGDPPLNLRGLSCEIGTYIDKGALRDQMVLSEALRALGETRIPGHAIVGSGRALLDPSFQFVLIESSLALDFDLPTGPYARAFAESACQFDGLANFIFNLQTTVPPVTGSGIQCSVVPDYDLVVSSYSAQGLLPARAVTTTADLGGLVGLNLIGRLNHYALHDPANGSPQIVGAVSDRVAFLLRQATTSPFFSPFPAIASVTPPAVEQIFSVFDPLWLEAGEACPDPAYAQHCPTYSEIKVVPSQLVLPDSTPTPLNVYGRLGDRWVLARAPVVLTLDPNANRNCSVTLEASDPAVVTLVTNTTTKSQAVTATGLGTTTLEVKVEGFPDPIVVPVTVEGVGQ
jgi:pimeloyl-ACP methyl ester carboxylesterase